MTSTLDNIAEGRAEDDQELLLTQMTARLAGAGYRTGNILATRLAVAASEVGGDEQAADRLLELFRRGGLLDMSQDMGYADVHSEIILSERGAAILERYASACTSGATQRRAQYKAAQTGLLLWFSEHPDTGTDDFLQSPYGYYFGQRLSLERLDAAFKSLTARGLVVDYIESNNLGSYARVTLSPEGDACVADFNADVGAWDGAQRSEATAPNIRNVFNSQVGNVVQGGSVSGGLSAVHVSQSNPQEIAELLLALVKASRLAGELDEPEVAHVADQVTSDLQAIATGDADEGRLARVTAAMRAFGTKTAGGAATALGSTTVQTLVNSLAS